MQLQSVYRTVMGSEPPYTNYTGNFKGVLDYVWFSSPHIRPLAVAPVRVFYFVYGVYYMCLGVYIDLYIYISSVLVCVEMYGITLFFCFS